MKSDFEKLPFVALMLDDNFIYVEQSNEYTHKNHTEHRVMLGYLNGAWLTYQHQQSKVDELQKQLIDQGQRFNDQAQRVKDLEHKNEELQKRVNDSQDIIESILARSLDNPEIQDLCGQLIDVLEKGIKGGEE